MLPADGSIRPSGVPLPSIMMMVLSSSLIVTLVHHYWSVDWSQGTKLRSMDIDGDLSTLVHLGWDVGEGDEDKGASTAGLSCRATGASGKLSWMGAWGPGLYSDDYALDLKTLVVSICRLPLDGEQILSRLVEMSPPAVDETDENFPTFWLVVADQMQRRGVESEARLKALGIIDSGLDIEVHEALGMGSGDLEKRQKALDRLAVKLRTYPEVEKRRTLKKPQPLLAERGDVFVYPVDRAGRPLNPYFSDCERDLARFNPVGWRSCLLLDASHAFGFLAWYRFAASLELFEKKPDLSEAIRSLDHQIDGVGTLSPSHFKRLGLELVGRVDPPIVDPTDEAKAVHAVSHDISAGGCLGGALLSVRRDILGDLARVRVQRMVEDEDAARERLSRLAAAAELLGMRSNLVSGVSGLAGWEIEEAHAEAQQAVRQLADAYEERTIDHGSYWEESLGFLKRTFVRRTV